MSSYGRKLVRGKKANDRILGEGDEAGELQMGAVVEQALGVWGMEEDNGRLVEYGVIGPDGMMTFKTLEEMNEWLLSTDYFCLES